MKEALVTCICRDIRLPDLGLVLTQGQTTILDLGVAQKSEDLQRAKRFGGVTVQIVERCRDTGVHPIFGTNNPQQSGLVVKSNLVTRISLAVPALAASVMALGVSGAEKLPKVQGRGLIERDARMVEFQAFLVDCPMPSDEALRIVADSVETVKPDVGEIERLATSIREKWSPDMSKRKTAELLGKTYAGAWAAKIDQIIEFLGATTTTKPVFMTEINLNTGIAE